MGWGIKLVRCDIPAPRNILCSYWYFKDYDLDQLDQLTIIGDSGAFSARSQGATITTRDLAEWATQWKHKLKWVASLDVIGNPVRTYSNWRDMVDLYGIQAIPTIHYGTQPQELDRYGKRGVDLVGLGGMVNITTKQQMRWLIQVFKYAREHWPNMVFHGWGCTSQPHFKLPFYSVDSSSWTASLRYGQGRIIDPDTGKLIAFRLNGRDAFRPDVAPVLVKHYGVSPRDVAVSNAATREMQIRIAALSESVREQLWRKRMGPVREPLWGVNCGPKVVTGGGVHLANCTIQDHLILNALSH